MRPVATLVLATIELRHRPEAARRAMLLRAIRATIGSAHLIFGPDVDAYRCGESGIGLAVPEGLQPSRGAAIAPLLRARLEELLASMAATVRAFAGAEWSVRVGETNWSPDVTANEALTPCQFRDARGRRSSGRSRAGRR